jgi:hypothetical protein
MADLKYNQNIKTYWTTDGRVYAKLNESSRRTLIRNHDDIIFADIYYDIICVNRVNDMTSIVYGYINVMESKTGPPGILFLVLALMDEHIIPLNQTLKEQQKQIDEQKEMISKQAHLVVQRIQEEQHLKSSLKEKDKEVQ